VLAVDMLNLNNMINVGVQVQLYGQPVNKVEGLPFSAFSS
jgi:hypothetical protein